MASVGPGCGQQRQLWRWVGNYALAVAMVAVTFALRLALAPACGSRVMLNLFSLPVLLCAYFGGVGPGLLATALVTLSVICFLPSGFNFGSLTTADAIMMALFVVTNLVIIVLVEGLHRTRRQLEQTLTERTRVETALDEDRQLLRTLINNLPDLIFTKDMAARFIISNTAHLSFMGVPDEAALAGKTVLDLHPEELARGYYEDDLRVMRTGQAVINREELVQNHDGVRRWFLTIKAPLRDRTGKITGLVAVCRDITERRKADQALRESERLLREVIDLVPHHIFAKDRAGRYLFINRAAAASVGRRPEEPVGHLELEFSCNKEQTAAFLKADQEVIDSGQTKFIPEETITFADGSVHWMQTTKMVFVPPDATERAVMGVAVDITEHKHAEQVLAESEEHYRLLAEHTEDFVSVHDVREQRLYISPSYYRATGWTPEEVQNSPWDARLHPDELPAIKQARAANLAGRMTLLEHRILRRNGDWLWIESRSKPILGADGQMQQLVIWSHDITERKRAEAELQARERLLREVIDLVPHHIFAKDREGRYLFVNRAASICYGKEPQELVGHLELEFAPNKEQTAAFLKDDLEVIASGKPKFIPEEPSTFSDGSVHWLQTTKTAFVPPGATERAVIGVAVDITGRKRAEQALAESEEKFRRIAANIDDVLYSVDAITREFIYINPAFEQVLGYSLEDIKHMGGRRAFLAQVIRDGKFEEQERLMDSLQSPHSVNLPDRWETWWRCKDGSLKCMEDHWIVVYSGDRLVATEGVLRNVTERKRLEAQVQQAQKMEAVGQLAGGVAHDFNNILQSILGFTDILLAETPPATQHHGDLLEIRKSAERAAGLTRQLLAFSRRQMIMPTVVDLNSLVSNMHKMLHRLIGEDIQLVTELAADLPRVKADAGQIEQVIMNLVLNARDAMPQGGRMTLTTASMALTTEDVHFVAEGRAGQFVRLTLSDTGTGIAPDVLPHIFEPFFSTKGPGQGTGLGLSVIYGIAQQHNGWVNVYSQLGHGTAFKLYLPTYAGAEDLAAAPHTPPAPPRGHSERILLIEDEPEVRSLATRVLLAAGYDVLAAGSAVEGRALFARKNGRFDLVFSDVVLPDQNGITTVEQFLQTNPDLAVLLCSGYTDERSRWHTIAEKKFPFLQKPYPAAELLRTIHAILDARPVEQP